MISGKLLPLIFCSSSNCRSRLSLTSRSLKTSILSSAVGKSKFNIIIIILLIQAKRNRKSGFLWNLTRGNNNNNKKKRVQIFLDLCGKLWGATSQST